MKSPLAALRVESTEIHKGSVFCQINIEYNTIIPVQNSIYIETYIYKEEFQINSYG